LADISGSLQIRSDDINMSAVAMFVASGMLRTLQIRKRRVFF